MPPGLRLLDVTLGSPAENLALDEALLLDADALLSRGESASCCEVLRFWESPVPFVVLGVACRLEDDVDEAACARHGVPILRRGSGGGTVLQGPGCLNFALVLSLESRRDLRDVTRSYQAILGRVAAALGEGIVQRGTSDLAAAGLKLSGNAQKRTRRALLHHGTILHAASLELIAAVLREPRQQPEYRGGRAHASFLRNLPLPAAEIKARLAAAWEAKAPGEPAALPELAPLIAARHGDPQWVRRF